MRKTLPKFFTAFAGALLFSGAVGCGHTPEKKSSNVVGKWPAEAVFAAYPVIHCIPEALPRAFVADIAKAGKSEDTAREVYIGTRDLVLTTLNLFLATGRWAGSRANIRPTREQPRVGTPPECRMFELALADEISLRLPPSVAGEPFIVPIAMVGYDYEPASAGKAPRISVRIAALLARGDGHVLQTVRALASTDYAQASPSYQERSSQEVAQSLTEELFRNLSKAFSE